MCVFNELLVEAVHHATQVILKLSLPLLSEGTVSKTAEEALENFREIYQGYKTIWHPAEQIRHNVFFFYHMKGRKVWMDLFCLQIRCAKCYPPLKKSEVY